MMMMRRHEIFVNSNKGNFKEDMEMCSATTTSVLIYW